MGVKDRLRRLEGGDPQPCSVCEELSPEGAGDEVYKVVWEDTGFDVPEFCPACGEQLAYTVTWGDE